MEPNLGGSSLELFVELRVTITVAVGYMQYTRTFRGESRRPDTFSVGNEGRYESALRDALLDLATQVFQEIRILLERSGE